MFKTFSFCLLFFSLLQVSRLCAQTLEESAEIEYTNEGKGWIFGLSMGAYYPSKYSSAYYNGSPANENNAKFILDNKYRYEDIFRALGANDTIMIQGFPQNTHYKLAMQPGLYAQYCFNPKVSLTILFTYMKLKVNDVITFEVDPKQYATEPDLRLMPLRGLEERIYGDIGLKFSFPQTDKLSYFITGGFNINSTQVRQSSFYVGDVEYKMNERTDGSYVPNTNNEPYSQYQGGIGFGMYTGAGATFIFGNGMAVEPGITAHWLMVRLDRYKNMSPGAGLYIRFLL